MPYAWTHMIFGDTVLEKGGFPPPGDEKMFHLGCQGPDFLFFHRFWPWVKDDRVSRLGSAMHLRRCGPFLRDLIEEAKEKTSIRDAVTGFITHHILDRTTHPYIHYRAGYEGYNHQRMEVTIDTLVARKLAGIETWRTPLAPRIDMGPSLPEVWTDVFDRLARKHYPEETENIRREELNEAYRDMLKALRIFYDPWGIKRALTLGKIDPFRHTPYFPHRDYLNESESEWRHPAVPEETHRESFWTLWERALEEATGIVRKTREYWSSSEKAFPETLRRAIGNISYDTGKDCDLNLVNKAADPIF
ncbi:hypothetical protein SAMN04488025_106130 [Planifilum fulgidum]|uniref:Zinc dependent phospholipase C n=1 Tax=Planifilum fulgidum TaxID=201973 RepID=A0A1I2LZW2_9BACL|nr:hypothetical protein [Planifilum fulgidum]MBO2497672.1 hypothetical protein [Bacillota bacterium]MBO2532977.1 hypothetical protein [Thermoactinomycetaceae bacterium]SFF84783.1 hypothetical protein SAMN04488025_106130 [Planifilum fulgidum]